MPSSELILNFLEPIWAAGLLLPLLLSTAVLAAARPRPGARLWAGALAVGGGCLAGWTALRGWPPFPPPERMKWLPYLGLAATALGLVDGARAWAGWLRWPPRAAGWGAAVWLLLQPRMVNESWGTSRTAALLAGLGAAGLVLWWVLDRLSERLRGASLSLALLVVVVGSALVAVKSGLASSAALYLVLAGTLGGGVIAGGLWRDLSLARGGTTVLAVLLPWMWLLGYFYAEVPAASIWFLALALPAVGLVSGRWVQRFGPGPVLLLRLAAAAAFVALAVKWAVDAAPPGDEF